MTAVVGRAACSAMQTQAQHLAAKRRLDVLHPVCSLGVVYPCYVDYLAVSPVATSQSVF